MLNWGANYLGLGMHSRLIKWIYAHWERRGSSRAKGSRSSRKFSLLGSGKSVIS